MAIANARPIKFQTPYLDKCQTCKKPLSAERKEVWGAKRVEFSDFCYYFCSRACINVHNYYEAMERGENREEYFERISEEKILTQQAIKEFDKKNSNNNSQGDN